jgi:hypothetical protein
LLQEKVKSQLHFGSKAEITFNQKSEGIKNAKSLKVKWGAIKHYGNKFVGVYGYVVAFNESKTSQENTFAKRLGGGGGGGLNRTKKKL